LASLPGAETAQTVRSAVCLLSPMAQGVPESQPHSAAYTRTAVIPLDGPGAGQFADEVRGIGIGADGTLLIAGDTKLVTLKPDGQYVREWRTASPPNCVTATADAIFVGEDGGIEVFAPDGTPQTAWRDAARLRHVTAVAVFADEVLVADTGDRCLRSFERSGKFRSDIGKDTRMKGFLIPNGYLDFAADRDGLLWIANAGMHRVEQYTRGGERRAFFGRFDGQDPAGFPGCCNPTNIAVTPQGDLVVSEKADPRLKVYSPAGALLAVFGTSDFDATAKNIDLAVDAHGRIYAIEPVRRQVIVYAPSTPPASAPAAPVARGHGTTGTEPHS
jgi:hypothetical protein